MGDIRSQISFDVGHERNGSVLAHDLVIRLNRSNLGETFLRDRLDCQSQTGFHLVLKIPGGGVLGAVVSTQRLPLKQSAFCFHEA